MWQATNWWSSHGIREERSADSSGGDRPTPRDRPIRLKSGSRPGAQLHRYADRYQVAFRVLEPGALCPAHVGDAIDRLEHRGVVLFELDAFGLEILDGPLDILHLDRHLRVGPGRLPTARK